MANTEFDRCRNCLYWDVKTKFCTKHDTETKLKSWCEEHFRADLFDLKDPANLYDLIRDRAILKMQCHTLKPWDGDILQQFRDAHEAFGYGKIGDK